MNMRFTACAAIILTTAVFAGCSQGAEAGDEDTSQQDVASEAITTESICNWTDEGALTCGVMTGSGTATPIRIGVSQYDSACVNSVLNLCKKYPKPNEKMPNCVKRRLAESC